MTAFDSLRTRTALAGLLLLLLAAPGTAANTIRWRTDYDTARKEAVDKGLPLFVEVGTESCYYCKKMASSTFADPVVVQLVNSRFVPLKIDANREPQLVQALKVRAYPTTILAGNDGKIHAFLQGYVAAEALKEQVNRVLKSSATPEWIARDFLKADQAIAANQEADALELLNGILREAKDTALKSKAEEAVRSIQAKAKTELSKADGLADSGAADEAAKKYGDIARRFPGTEAAQLASARLKVEPKPTEDNRAKQILTVAKEDFQAGRFADCLERCERITAGYPELDEATAARTLAARIKTNPERMSAACRQADKKSANLYLTLAESWERNGNKKEAAECLEKVLRLRPDSEEAEIASERLAYLKSETKSRSSSLQNAN